MPQINANLTLNTTQAQATFNQFVRSISSGRLGQPLGRISGDAAEFNKSMQAATARVTAFGLSAGAILQVKNAIVAAASATIEVDKQLIELNTFLGQSTSELDKFSKSLFQIAKNTAAPFSDAAGAAKEFARQGLSANEVLERTGAALTLARISGLGYQDSVQGITTAINSFGKEALKATEITNKLIAVDTRFAVSSADLNEAIRRVGSSAEESGVGIDSLIAAVTAAQQTTGRGGAVIGNALKTIFTRLQRPEVLGQLEQLGVAVRDQNGFLLDGIGILKNYSDATKNLSQSEKSRTAELIGGIYQINQLNALIKDLSSSNSVYANSLSISNSATDEAKKKNEELNKSLSSMLQGIKNTATEAASSLGSSFLRPIVEIGTSVSENLLKLVNPSGVGSELGSQIIKGLAGALGEGLSRTALPLLGSLAGLLAVKMGGFGKTAFKELAKSSGNVFESKKELQMQERINDVVSRNPGLISQINAGKITQKQAEAQILDLILRQNQELRAQAALSQRTFTTVTQAAPRKKRFGMFADGYLPSAGVAEENTARGFGAKNPKAKIIQATIKGKTGPVMVNNEEDVIPNFAGTGETAIIPRYRKLDEIPRMAKGYVPNFAFSSMKSLASEDRKFVDPETYSYLRYKLSNDKKAIDLKFSKSEMKGQGWQMFERLGKTARRMGLPVRSSNLSSQTNDVLDITDASLARAGKYGIEEVLKVGYPQLIHRQKGSSKNTTLSLNIDDGLGHKNKELSGKDIFSVVSDFASEKYKGNAKLFRNSIIDGSFDISNVETNFAGGRIPNFAKRRDIIQKIGKKEIFARFQKHFEKGKDYQGFYNIHGEEFNNRKLTAQEAKIYANITSAISPSVPDYVAAQFAAPIFNRYMKTKSTNVEDYFDLAPTKIVSRHKNVASLGLFGLAGTLSKKGKIRTRDDVRRSGLSKALRGIDLGSDDTAKTRHYARAILQDKTAFPIDTNVIQAILGGKKPSKTEAAKLVSLANEFATLNKIETGAAGLQAAIFKSNSKHTEKYSPDTVRSALSSIQGRSGGYVPNFANPRIVGQGSNLFVSSLYDTLSGEHGGGPEYPFARPGMGAAFLNKEKTNDMIKLIKPFVESGSRVVFGAQAGRMGGDLGLIQGLAGNKMVVEALKASYPKLTSKFIQEGTSTADLTSLFGKFYKTLGPDKMREIVSPFIEPDILKFYQKNKNFGSSISRLAEFGSESLTQASSSGHSIYPAAIRGKALSRIEPVNAQKLFQTAGGLSDEETKKLFGTVRVAKLPIGFRFEKGDAASKLLGLSQGYIPNFSGLSEAVSREKTMSGLPASQIMAHFDGGGNPVAVTNKRDEPNGLKDVPNFAIPRSLLRFLSTRNKGLTNPVSGGSELFAGNLLTAVLNVLAENEKVSPDIAASASAIPAGIGITNVIRALTSKRGTSGQKLAAGLTGAGQIGYAALTGYSAKTDLEKRINEKRYAEALDRSKTAFQNLTENTAELADTFAKLEAAYRDPQADPRTITKLAKKQQELLNKVSLKNPDLAVKLASENDLGKKQTIIEDSAKEAQRQESIRQASLKFSAQGKISGKDASAKISDFFSEIINAGNAEVLNQDLSQAKPKDFGDILKKGGLNIAEFSQIFQTDELKQAFIDGLKATQKLNEISQQQASAMRELSKPLTDKKQKIEDARAVRLAVSGVLKEQLPELASFAGGFSKRAGIAASSAAGLAITRSETSVAFNNTLQGQLADPKFSAGLPVKVRNRLLGIESPSKETAKELESLKTLPGLSKEQVSGIDKLIDFNNQQNRKLENANKIASETKNIQLKFLALQEKLAFGGDIRSSIDPEARRESMASAIRGPLTYQLGGLLGSKRTQIGGATDFLTDTIKKYPGLLQTKDGKEPADIQGVKRELTGLNANDMQRDLLKRAGMAEMMGLGQTGSMLRSKAFDQNYLLESAGLKTSALFGSPEVPEEVRKAMEEYEKFNVKGVREFKGEEKQLKGLEDLLAPIKQAMTDALQTEGKTLAEAFTASLNKTFGQNGIVTDLVNISTKAIFDKDASNKNVENAAKAYAGQGGLMPTGIGSNANGLTKYSSSIADAVKREKTALASRGIMGVPNFAMAGINLERSPDLMTPSNPAGFAITNSIDEKNGLRSLGMRSSGFVPNYALPSWMSASNLDKARSVFTNADDAQSLLGNIKEGNIGGAAMDLAGPALDAAKFAAKNVAKKAGLGAAGIGLDVGEYIVKPLSEKLGVTDYLADRMYNALYAKPEKSNIARASDAYNSRLGNDLIDPSPEYMKKAKVPNFALFGDEVAAAGLAAIKDRKLFVYDQDASGFYPVGPGGTIEMHRPALQKASLPRGAKTISNQPYHRTQANDQLRGSNILGIKDPKFDKLDELKLSTVPKSQLLDPVLKKLSEAGNLNPDALQNEIKRMSGGKPTMVKTAYGPNNLQSLGVFGRGGNLPESMGGGSGAMISHKDAAKIIKRFKGGEDSGFFMQAAVAETPFGEARAHVSVDANGRVKLIKGGTINKHWPAVTELMREHGISKAEALKQEKAFMRSAEATAVKSAREAVRKFGLKNTMFGVDVIATTLESAAEAGVNAKGFKTGGRGAFGTVAIEMNPSDPGGASGWLRSEPFVRSVLGLDENPNATRPTSPGTSPLPAPMPTSPGSNLIGTRQPSMPAGFTHRALPPLPRPTGPGSNLIGTQQPSMPAGFTPRGGEAPPIPGGTGGGLPPRDARGRFTARGGGGAPTGGSGGPPPSNSYFGSMAFGSNGGNPPSGSSTILNKLKGAGATGLKGLGLLFGAMQAKESYDQAKEGNYGKSTIAGLSSAASFAGLSKTAGKIAGPAGVALGALTDLKSDLTLAKDFKDILGRKERTYSVGPDGKTKEDVESIGAGDIIGTTIGAVTAAPVTAAILGYRTGNVLENKFGLGEKLGNFTSGVFSGGKSLVRLQESGKPIRGMTSKEAYDSDQILTRKMELVKEINKYNRAAGNPEISVGENISKAKKAQERKDEGDISALQEKLDKENKATRDGITARATAAGAAETAILNKKSTEEEEARRTKLRRSFIESFEKNGGAGKFQTTKEKVEYFLNLERQLNQGTDPNGFGTFKPTDFKDPEFANSFNTYRNSKEKEAAREAKRVFPKPTEEFKNRPPQQSFPDDVLREAVRTGRSAEKVMQDREDEKIAKGIIPPVALPSQTEIRNRPDPFTKDVLLEAARRRVSAEKIIQERDAEKARKDQLPLLPPALMGEIAIAGKSGSLIPGPLPSKIQGGEGFDPNKPDSYPADVVAEAIRTGRKPEQVIKDREQGIQATDVPGGYSKGIVEEAMNRRGLNLVPQAPLPPQPKPRDDSSDPFPRDVLLEATRRGVSAERVMQDRAGLGGGFMNADEANIRRGAMTQGMTLPEINQQEARETGLQNFPKDVLEEAMRRRVTAEQVMRERAGGAVPNFAAMSNSMMSSGDVYSRMRATSARSSMGGYSGGHVPNFAAGDFTNAISEAMKNGITSAFPNGGSSSSVSNSNVINIDGRTSIQNASDDAMQGIIGILFDKFPELKKLGPSALNFKR